MHISSITFRRLAALLAATVVALALAAPAALADPPNYPRTVPVTPVAAVHVPEIVAGLGSTGGTALASAPSTHVASRGFDWADAFLGAGIALVGVALASGGALALRKRVSLAH